MWICRRCAAHVEDEVLECPGCAAPAPARLHPELNAHVSESADQSPSESPLTFLVNRVIPSVEKHGQRRAVEAGALLGFLIPLIWGIIQWIDDFRHAPTFGNFFTLPLIVVVCLVPALLLALLGGISFGTLHYSLVGFGDFLIRRLGRNRDPQPRLLPSALAKTDSLGRRRRRRMRAKKQTGIIDPQHADRSTIIDSKLDIKPEDSET